jgi:hypothetical protein
MKGRMKLANNPTDSRPPGGKLSAGGTGPSEPNPHITAGSDTPGKQAQSYRRTPGMGYSQRVAGLVSITGDSQAARAALTLRKQPNEAPPSLGDDDGDRGRM